MGDIKEERLITKKFYHFHERLSERYGLLISRDEYVDLCKMWPRGKKRTKDGKAVIGKVMIQDKAVIVVKSILPPKIFLTVLPPNSKDERKNLLAFERHRVKQLQQTA